MLNIFILLFRGQHKVGNMFKGYLIMMGIIIICTTMNYAVIGLKHVVLAMVFIASLIVILYALSMRFQHRNFIGILSSNIRDYILYSKASRAKDMLKNINQHRAACDEIIFLFKCIRPNDAKFTYKKELKRLKLNLEKYKLDFDEEDEVLNPFKNWFYDVEKFYLNSYLENKPRRLLNKR